MGEQLPTGWRTLAERISARVPDTVWSDLEHHGYLRVDVRPDAVRGDWIAVEPGDEPLRPEVIGCWSVRPEQPVVIQPASPSSSTSSFGDVRRPGLPVSVLPAPDVLLDARRSLRANARRVVAATVASGVVVGAIWIARGRRR